MILKVYFASFVFIFAFKCTEARWRLVWADEFNGDVLDTKKWHYTTGCKPHNNELQCYTADRLSNVQLRDGKLIITARAELYKGRNFTSGRINSNRAWTFGRFEARARMPKGLQLWPAIWLLAQNRSAYGDWAASGEIDIAELRGEKPNVTMGTIHYGGLYPNSVSSGSGDRTFPFDFSKHFHIFTLEWSKRNIKWLIDGKQYHMEDINRNMWSGKGLNPYRSNVQPFDRPFHWILNVAVGGSFFGRGPYVTPEQAKQKWNKSSMEIDYVRVYQWQK